jgi:hypothetical protein
MSVFKNLLAGAAGAVALNILHESLKNRSDDMPRIDLLGEEALQKSLQYFGTEITDPDNLYRATLAGDVVSNSIYYSFIGAGSRKNVWPRAIALGIAAGVGAVALPKPLGLDPEPVARNPKVQALTVIYYLAGALITASVLKSTEKK